MINCEVDARDKDITFGLHQAQGEEVYGILATEIGGFMTEKTRQG